MKTWNTSFQLQILTSSYLLKYSPHESPYLHIERKVCQETNEQLKMQSVILQFTRIPDCRDARGLPPIFRIGGGGGGGRQNDFQPIKV